jgi:peptidoglycan hydrolase-like protein with peptidoglycan-binding domain
VIALVFLSIGLVVKSGWAIDPVLQQAQTKLSQLGYDPGVADGIYGPRTRRALEAFQRAQNLPVTGILDPPTLQALNQAALSPPERTPPLLPRSANPLLVVLDYLRYYAYQPARVLPYVTEHFRRGLPPNTWIEQTLQKLKAQEYTYLAWKVRSLEVTDTQATVEVYTRVQVQGQELSRVETFTLLHTAEDGWLIDNWLTKVAPTRREAS